MGAVHLYSLADGKATDVGRVVIDQKLIDYVRSELDADGVRTIDQCYIELAAKEEKEEFAGGFKAFKVTELPSGSVAETLKVKVWPTCTVRLVPPTILIVGH